MQYCAVRHIDGDHTSRGNYYSWTAAVNGNTSAAEQVQGVCPNGWHLPTSNTTANGSFGGLTAAYEVKNNATGSTTMQGAPLYFVYGGNAYVNTIQNFGSRGMYWSSTPHSDGISAYYLDIYDGTVAPSNSLNRSAGFSVRCLADF